MEESVTPGLDIDDGLIEEAETIWRNPQILLRLVDFMFIGSDPLENIPS